MNGCYQCLMGGVSGDALSDFTGLIYSLWKELAKCFFSRRGGDLSAKKRSTALVRHLPSACRPARFAHLRGDIRTLLLTLLPTARVLKATEQSEALLPNGLVCGHAYTVSDVEKLQLHDKSTVTLVRVRNPWGNQIEWKGAWSDRYSVERHFSRKDHAH